MWSSTCTPQYILISSILATLPSYIQQHWWCTKHKSTCGHHVESWNIYRIKGMPSWVTSDGMVFLLFHKNLFMFQQVVIRKHASSICSACMYLLSETSQKHHLDSITHTRLQWVFKNIHKHFYGKIYFHRMHLKLIPRNITYLIIKTELLQIQVITHSKIF